MLGYTGVEKKGGESLTKLSLTTIYSVDDRMISEFGTVGGKKTVRGNGNTRRKPFPVPFYPPQIPHDMA
jgi:hypothetical protein